MCTNTPSTSAIPKSVKKQPFSNSERELIVALVRERPIIEDKRTNAKNIELKRQAWEDLVVAYNAQPYVFPRNSTQLKRCWENFKTQRKKELSLESKHLTGTGGGPPQGSSPSNVIDDICPYINLQVPGVIDSNTIEISSDHKDDIYLKNLNETVIELPCERDSDKIKENKKRKSNYDSKEDKKLCNEIERRIKRCILNMDQDQALHKLRMEREKVLIERERNLLLFEKEMHTLQIEKIKLEIDLLKKLT